jgi:hypothetical protein
MNISSINLSMLLLVRIRNDLRVRVIRSPMPRMTKMFAWKTDGPFDFD